MDKQAPKFIIYALVDPRERGAFRYVGKSVSGESRLKTHLHPSKLSSCTYKNNWIRSLLSQGIRPELVILEEAQSPDKLYEMEKIAISKFRSLGHPLTNLTDGGPGSLGVSPSLETRTKQSSALTGRKHTKTHRRNVSISRRGMTFSEETCRRLSLSHGCGPIFEETTGRVFDSQSEAARNLGISQGAVSQVLSGVLSSVKGFRFKRCG